MAENPRIRRPGQRHGQPGRRTKAEEAQEYLTSLGLSAEFNEAVDRIGRGEERIQSFIELRRELLPILEDRVRNEKGNASVQAAKLVIELAELEGRGGLEEEQEAEPTVAEIIAGTVHIPADRKLVIVEAEQAKLREELRQLDVLAGELATAIEEAA